MSYEATMIINGYQTVHIGYYDNKEKAARAIIAHILENSGLPRPRVVATIQIRSKKIRIDYGSKTCYYLIERRKRC